jgi:hypothetical protein
VAGFFFDGTLMGLMGWISDDFLKDSCFVAGWKGGLAFWEFYAVFLLYKTLKPRLHISTAKSG